MNKDYISERIKELVGEKYTVTVTPTLKTNRNFTGISLRIQGSNIGPMIYLEDYDGYGSDEAIATAMAERLTQADNFKPEFDYSTLSDYEKTKSKIVFNLVKESWNEDLLEICAGRVFLDFILYYSIELGNGASARVTKTIMETWGKTEEELYEAAIKNTPIIKPACFLSMSEKMAEIMGTDALPTIPPEKEMHFLSNQKTCMSSGVILYENQLKQVADMLNVARLNLIPSSIHEWLVVPEGLMEPDEISDIIKEVNETQVLEEERLSDHVYFYDAETNKITY